MQCATNSNALTYASVYLFSGKKNNYKHKQSHHFQRSFRHSVNDAEKSIYKIRQQIKVHQQQANKQRRCNWKRNALKIRFESKRNEMQWERMKEKYTEYKRSQQFCLDGKKAYPAEIRSAHSMWQPNNQQRHSLNGKILRENINKKTERRTDSKPWHYHYGKGIPVMWMRLLTVFSPSSLWKIFIRSLHLFNLVFSLRKLIRTVNKERHANLEWERCRLNRWKW